jgi:hypothetical protein
VTAGTERYQDIEAISASGVRQKGDPLPFDV